MFKYIHIEPLRKTNNIREVMSVITVNYAILLKVDDMTSHPTAGLENHEWIMIFCSATRVLLKYTYY